jgi:hypothetical protein
VLRRVIMQRKLWTRSICGAEVPDLPMPVLKHQLSHVSRRAFAADRPVSGESDRQEPTEREGHSLSE